jgi:ABC-type Fe3+ transport system permease subunit
MGNERMKFLRRIHLYLGCVFAPLLVMFATSGAWQTFQLHRGRPGYDPPNILIQISSVHEAQRLMIGSATDSMPFRWFVVAMAVGIIFTVVLGVVLAFKVSRSAIPVLISLALGFIVPIILLYVGGGVK